MESSIFPANIALLVKRRCESMENAYERTYRGFMDEYGSEGVANFNKMRAVTAEQTYSNFLGENKWFTKFVLSFNEFTQEEVDELHTFFSHVPFEEVAYDLNRYIELYIPHNPQSI